MRWLMIVLLAAAAAAPARAENKPKAREAFYRATQHYDLGEYREALDAFKEAYRHFEDPSFLFNIGQAHRQLGEKEAAVRFYRTYLIKLPSASNRDAVHEMIARLERELADERATKQSPPQGLLGESRAGPAPAQAASAHSSASAPSPALIAASAARGARALGPSLSFDFKPAPPPPPRKPRYWIIGAVVGTVAAVGVGVGLGVGLTSSGGVRGASFGAVKVY
jgi:tetratricopeptide (TPR) repeat protein